MSDAADNPLLLYDGECGLCHRAVKFTIRHNGRGNVRFAALQSDVGREHLSAAGLPDDYRDSLVFVDEQGTHTKSKAALRLARHLDRPWRWLRGATVVPRPLRDWLYRGVAKNRFHLFGHADACELPSPEQRARFVS